MFTSFRIRTQLLLGMGAIVLCLLAFGGVTLWMGERAAAISRVTALEWRRTLLMREIQMYQLDVQALVRGIIITRNDYLKGLYDERMGLLMGRLDAFEAAAAGDGEMAAIVDRLRDAVIGLRDSVYARQVKLAMNPDTVGEAVRIETSGEGWPALEQVLKTVDEMTALQLPRLEASAEEVRSIFALQGVLVPAALAAIALVSALLAFLIARALSRPITSLSTGMRRLAGGERDLAVDAAGAAEIREMAEAVGVFRESMRRNEQLQQQALERQQAELLRGRTIEELTGEFERQSRTLVEALGAASDRMTTDAHDLTEVAQRSGEHATEVSTASAEAAHSVQTVASATTELAASIREISEQVGTAATLAQETMRSAEQSKEVVSALDETARAIGEVVTLINDIAAQTNLLALNATIEAARAGDAGKGFAVVAGEVKSLANQTASATGEIAGQITAIQERSQAAVTAIAAIAKRIEEMHGITAAVAAAVEQQNAATDEISRSIEQVSESANQVNRNVAYLSEGSLKTGEVAQSVYQASQHVGSESRSLSERIDAFLTAVAKV